MKSKLQNSTVIDQEKIISKGRGGGVNSNPGNLDYRRLAEIYRETYKSSELKSGKREIVNAINDALINNGYTLMDENKEAITGREALEQELSKKTSQLLREKGVKSASPNNLDSVLKMSQEVNQRLAARSVTQQENVESKLESGKKRAAPQQSTWVSKVSPIAKRTRSSSDVDKKASDVAVQPQKAKGKLKDDMSYSVDNQVQTINEKSQRQQSASVEKTFYESMDDGWADRIHSPTPPSESVEQDFDLSKKVKLDNLILQYAQTAEVDDIEKNKEDWKKRVYDSFGGNSKDLGL